MNQMLSTLLSLPSLHLFVLIPSLPFRRFQCPSLGVVIAPFKREISTHITKLNRESKPPFSSFTNLKTRTQSEVQSHGCRFHGCSKSYRDASSLIRHEKSRHGFYRKVYGRAREPGSTSPGDSVPSKHGSVPLPLPIPIDYSVYSTPSPTSSASPLTPGDSSTPTRDMSPFVSLGFESQPQQDTSAGMLAHDALPQTLPEVKRGNQHLHFAADGFGMIPQVYLPQTYPSAPSFDIGASNLEGFIPPPSTHAF